MEARDISRMFNNKTTGMASTSQNNYKKQHKMKATVLYNDYTGTTAADRSDLFFGLPEQMCQIIFEKFNIPLDGKDYIFVGISVNSTSVDDAYATFYFKKRETQQVVKVIRSSVKLQTILDMFKRFEFQVGYHMEDIDEYQVEEVAKEEE